MRRFRTQVHTLIGFVVGLTTSAQALTLAEDGKPAATIVLATGAIPSEQTAAQELADYLRQISGAAFPVVTEDHAPAQGSRLLVGPTTFARSQGLTPAKLGPEEWSIRTVGDDLIILGGRPRGTLYGAYHFLEDVLGVHWWNPFEDTVPRQRTVRIDALKLQGRPVIQYRDIYMLYAHDEGRFAARNRLNRAGDEPIAVRYGGARDYGPPYHVHTFHLYFPPRQYFTTHPEWYSLVGGRRVDDGQLCLTQPELRRAFLEKLLDTIGTSRAAAKEAGTPPPTVFSVSQNDCLKPCECAACQAIARREESESGPLLDFVNFLADGIKDRHPDVLIDTLAYDYTQKPPQTIRPRDNVVVRLCDTGSDPTQPITSPANQAFREQLLRWAQIARNLRVCDYAVTYASPVGMPMPTAHTYGPDYRFYAEHHVEGVFTELEFEILADLRDFKVWILMKQLEDPYADYAKLAQVFTDGFYGPAGQPIRQYLTALEQEAVARRTRANLHSTPTSLTYLNSAFLQRAHELFEQAERAVADDASLRRRVRHARLPLDRATVALHPLLTAEWLARGKPAGQGPPDRSAIARRALDTWLAQARLRLPTSAWEREKQQAEAELRRYASLPHERGLPEKFRALPPGRVCDYTATMMRNCADMAKVVKDPEAESGIANRLDLTDGAVDRADKYVLPMPWGLYATAEKKVRGGTVIRAEDVPGPGYHWYPMGSFPIAPGYYVYFFWSWIIQVDVDNVFDPAHPDQKHEVWARIKFTGPRFPHARPGDQNAIYLERLVLVKSDR